ncbi:TIGR03960 family B12-binding radical SAM protein [Leptolyngbya sp. FACHB-261]|uniref:TIGR03960 family B12-binding radical SAM protein n=1 Tax=Leptolyngbya sp. FACHB-261 TaxID=2692806 RepID=UPI001689D36B|nr:TIGR03960 family B12-binding radical SAM protein [Leptolyngbya sp. FACHB-261]MBD2099608.1 TIGR03960 family B12-binding radical SAM protein [Leptolyngbya sp. FACHB-261]
MPVPVEQLITPEILKPARYLGNELGAVHKPWNEATVRWCLTYPEIYEVGASNLGHIILYNILNTQPRQLCDRAYLPAADLAAKLRETGTPLFAVESKRSLLDFDILGFSLSYELGATNILEMLDLAGVPLTWQARTLGVGASEKEQLSPYPLIFAGGPTATSNPEPYVDFLDFIVLGDGEEVLPEIGLVLEEGKQAGLTREALLLDLAQVPGVYVPRFYDMRPDGSVVPNRSDVPERILRRVAAPMPEYSIGLVPYVQTVHDRLAIEVRRGCTRGCRFCQPGMLTRPARDVEPEAVVDAIEKGMRATGYNEFSLLSLSCSDYLALPAVGMEIKNRLKDQNISLSLPSQRVDRFDENIANIIGGTRQSGLTFAPEAGTQRLRDVINKGLTNEELLRGVKTAYEQGWDKVKLYFMIGLPGETDVDVIGIAETIHWLQRECYAPNRKRLNVTITISNFTPKPHTPFQWHSVSTEEFERKQELLKAEFRRLRGVKVNFTDVRISAMEDFVGRGDRRLGPVVQRAWELGAGMDSWWESLDRAFGAWSQAIAEAGLPWKLPAPSLEDDLPWDHLDTGIDKQWLKEDYQRALNEAIVPDCSFEGCSHCGVCGTEFGHNIVLEAPPIPQFEGHFKPETARVQRLRLAFGKRGSMALVSHLDLVRLFDRVMRRAALPIAFTGGFHPSPRIAIASALALGATSNGEIADFELTRRVDPDQFLTAIKAQLPEDLPAFSVSEIPLAAPSATQALQKAEYQLTVSSEQPVSWSELIDRVRAAESLPLEMTNKKGKTYIAEMRDRLFELDCLTSDSNSADNQATVHYIGSLLNDGTTLRPEQLVTILGQFAEAELDLVQVHRQRLLLDA